MIYAHRGHSFIAKKYAPIYYIWVWNYYFFTCTFTLNILPMYCSVNTLRPRQNGRHFADGTFNRIFVNENVRISIKFSLKFVPKGPINNIPALVQIMAWRRPGDKPLSEPVMVSLLTHICVTRPQWVKTFLLVNLMYRFAVAGVRTSGTSHFTIGQSLSILTCPADKAIWIKKGNMMQAAENRFSGAGITVRLLDCFNSPHLATTQQSLNCQTAHVMTVKQFGCLRSSVRRSTIFGPCWLIKSETRYWDPAWMSNHVHISMEWNYLILIHSQTSAVAPLKIYNG